MRSDLKGDGMAEMHRRHTEAKRRAALAEGAQHLLRKAHELSEKVKDMPQWVDSRDVPDK